MMRNVTHSTVVGLVMIILLSSFSGASKMVNTQIIELELHTQTHDISGSAVHADRQKRSRGSFYIDYKVSTKDGFQEAHQVVLAFYEANEAYYQETGKAHELVAFVVRSKDDRFYVTNAVEAPANFKLHAKIRKPKDWESQEVIHTHPPTRYSQEVFSVTDRKAVLNGLPGYYLRTPLGDARYLDRKLAKIKHTDGALGISICPEKNSCLPVHQQKLK